MMGILEICEIHCIKGSGWLSRSAWRCSYGQEVTRVAGWGGEVQECVAAGISMVFGVPTPINAHCGLTYISHFLTLRICH
jgi:hypothetical protein